MLHYNILLKALDKISNVRYNVLLTLKNGHREMLQCVNILGLAVYRLPGVSIFSTQLRLMNFIYRSLVIEKAVAIPSKWMATGQWRNMLVKNCSYIQQKTM